MKVCVIGGAGYIGSHAVYELKRANHEVVVIDNLSTGHRHFVPTDVSFYEGDITDKVFMHDTFALENSKKPIDVVMHFAGKIIVPESMKKPLEYFYNNVEGVRVMLETMTQFNIKNIVFSSTAAVYGNPTNGICHEEEILNPINVYGETKLMDEKMIKWTSEIYGMNYCIFRYFNVAGADASLEIGYDKKEATHILPIIAQTIIGVRDKMVIFGNDYDTSDGTCIRDYVHVTDLAKAHVLGVEYLMREHKNLIVNLGSNNGYSVKEVVDIAYKIRPFNYEFGPRREGDPAKLIASNDKAKNILGWQPTLTLEDIVNSDINYCLKINSNR